MEELIKKEDLMQINPAKDEMKEDSNDLFTNPMDFHGTICLDLPEPREAIHHSKHDKYMVPVFTAQCMTNFVGNGVIVGSYLITAAHVAKNKEENFPILYYKYEDDFKMVSDDDVIFDGRKVKSKNGNCNDLIVYKFDGIVGGFKCNDTSVEKGTKLYTSFYTYLDNGRVVFDGNLCVVDSLGTLSLDKTTYWQNCYRVYNSRGFIQGNSGCAFYCDDVLYGILLGGSEPRYGVYKYTVLDASYIRRIIEEFGE
jgi:hypothetical protein